MKFLCPNCKAKYRIGPEKMVGRQAAKIRCRKCEYLIQIAYRGNSEEFDVTATPPTVAPPPPGAAPARASKPSAGQPATATNPARARLGTGTLGSPLRDEGSGSKRPTAAIPGLPGLGSPKSTRGAALHSDAAAMPRRPLAPLPPPPPPPVPPIAGAALGAALPQPTIAPTPAGGTTTLGLGAVQLQPSLSAPASSPATPPRSPNSTQLGDQFRESVQAGGVVEDLPEEGWFVGVNGVPLGPIPLGDLRELAMAGHIDRRSLVWRDGQGEWRPLGKFPGLARVIDDGASPLATPSPEPMAAPAPQARANGARANGHMTTGHVATGHVATGHSATGFDVARADAGERPSAWGDLDDEDDADEQPTTVKGRVSVFPGPDALPASAPSPPQPSGGLPRNAANPFGVTSSVLAVPPPARPAVSAAPVGMESSGPGSSMSVTPEPAVDADVGMIRSPGRNRRYLIVVAIIIAFALGAFIATNLMRWSSATEKPDREGSSSEPSRLTAESEGEGRLARSAAEDPSRAGHVLPSLRNTERAPPDEASRMILGATVMPPTAVPQAPANSARPAAATSSLLVGLGVAEMPGPGLARVDDRAVGAGLDATAVQRTVRRYSPGVRQNCWQRALNAGAPDAPSSAKVSATITVDAAGHVQAVSVTGAPRGYPGLSRCIEGAVRSWQFPRSGGQTITNVPFMFVGR